MTTIRPTHLPAQTAAQPTTMDPAKSAAQRAFFQAALGGAAKPAAQATQTTQVATAAAPAASTPTVFAQPVQRIPDPNAEAPTRILRPGSLLDIRV